MGVKKSILCQTEKQNFEYPLVSFLFHFPFKGRGADPEEYETGLVKYLKKPDVDNLAKLYLDAMTGVLWEDDDVVMLGAVMKAYHPEPKTIIHIAERGPKITAAECGMGFFLDLTSAGFVV